MPDEFLLRSGYQRRDDINYFDDAPTDITYQPDVYTNAAFVAKALGCRSLVDVGCGNGHKLVPFANDFELVGLDFGANIERCRAEHSVGTWFEYDLMESEDLRIPISVDGAAIICSDVIEHLPRPDLLARKLAAALETARVVLISTPERDLRYAGRNQGPPRNPSHVREWTIRELGAFLRRQGLEHGSIGLTRSNDSENLWYTILAAYAASPEHLAVVENVLIDAPVPKLPEPKDDSVGEPSSGAAGGSWHRVRRAFARQKD